MKKIFAVLLIAALTLTFLPGCESRLAYGVRYRREASVTTEITKDMIFSEEEGYHFYEITWGLSKEELQKFYTFSMDSVAGLSEDGSITYKLNGFRLTILGRLIDDSTLTISPENRCVQASAAFSAEQKNGNKKEGDPDEETLFKEFVPVLEGWFGPCTDYVEDSKAVQSTSVRYCTYTWDYVRPDGQETRMQWSTAYVGTASVPSFVSLGFLISTEGEAE